ncbi:MAG: FAD:protein FMN transferase [Thermodesulfovibrionales bacterium]
MKGNLDMRDEKLGKSLSILIFFLSVLPLLACSTERERVFRKSKILMDTLVTINVVASSEDKAERAIDKAFDEIRRLEGLISFWSEDSEIAEINRKAGISPVKVSPLTLDIIEKALYVSEKTGGAFDPTVGPLMRLWDFKKGIIPDEGIIKDRLKLVDYREMVIDRANSTAFLRRKGMSFDTGGIAKGYAADLAVSVLKREGIKGGLVAVAGDIKAFGTKPDGRPWLVGIRNPRPKDKDDEVIATIELKEMAISTSGDYERFFIKDGKRYHHIMNPKTGQPATGCQSVTVITKEGVFTDGFSTGIFVLGPERGLRLLEELGYGGVIIDTRGKIHITKGLNLMLHKFGEEVNR